jgi:hypothetical protein
MPAPLFTSNPAEFTRLEGLYIFEQNPPGFIRGVSLGTVGIFGRCVKGPVDTPVEITSEARFLEVFGGRSLNADGTGALVGDVWRDLLNKPFGKLVIVRAALAADATASFNQEDTDGGAGAEIIQVSATSPGAWGNNVGFRIEDATDGDANAFNLVVKYHGGTVTYENLKTFGASDDNLASVIGDDIGNLVVVTKLADGRPLNTDSHTGAYLAALDTGAIGGYMNLGTVVASFTSVAGTTGTLTAADYTGTDRALDQIKEYKGVGVVLCSEADTEATVDSVNTAMITAAAAASDRLFLLWSGNHADSVATVVSDVGAFSRNDRIVFCYNSPKTLDPEIGTLLEVPPHAWMASILSQTDVDIHPGEEATKAFTAGISELRSESLTREDYVTLREAGIAALERDEGFVFVSGVVIDLTPGKTEITRRRSADFLQLSAGGRLKFYVKKKNLAETRRIMGGELIDFSSTLKAQQRVVEEFEVDQESVNTAAQRAQGLEFILWRVKLIGHILHLVLKTEIGTGVTIEVG